jgi:hypothetical protein
MDPDVRLSEIQRKISEAGAAARKALLKLKHFLISDL